VRGASGGDIAVGESPLNRSLIAVSTARRAFGQDGEAAEPGR
jgi:hypothetical protein